MPIFSATVNDTGFQTAQDVWEILAPATSRVRIREVRIGQYSEFADAQAELLNVRLITFGRNDTGAATQGTSGSGGWLDTGFGRYAGNIHGWTKAPTRSVELNAVNTTLALDTGDTGTNPRELINDTWNVAAGWWYYPPEEEMVIVEAGDLFVVRVSAPADIMKVTSTIVWEEAPFI